MYIESAVLPSFGLTRNRSEKNTSPASSPALKSVPVCLSDADHTCQLIEWHFDAPWIFRYRRPRPSLYSKMNDGDLYSSREALGLLPEQVRGVTLKDGSTLAFVQCLNSTGDRLHVSSLVIFLEDRRLLFGDRHLEDQAHCVASALESRSFLTNQISEATQGGPLEATLKAMRAAFQLVHRIQWKFPQLFQPREIDSAEK